MKLLKSLGIFVFWYIYVNKIRFRVFIKKIIKGYIICISWKNNLKIIDLLLLIFNVENYGWEFV